MRALQPRRSSEHTVTACPTDTVAPHRRMHLTRHLAALMLAACWQDAEAYERNNQMVHGMEIGRVQGADVLSKL
jgi:hypothetical protein